MSIEMGARYLSNDEDSFIAATTAAGAHPADPGLDLKRWRRRDPDKLVGQLLIQIPDKPQAAPALGGFDEAALERVVLRVQGRLTRPDKQAYASPGRLLLQA
ncbi:MAG: hypothetical protein P4M09_14290 [Devosia sp.]|nr:hypothetical protein [Devosia sp.]